MFKILKGDDQVCSDFYYAVKYPVYGKEFIEAEDRKERQKAEAQLKSQEWDE